MTSWESGMDTFDSVTYIVRNICYLHLRTRVSCEIDILKFDKDFVNIIRFWRLSCDVKLFSKDIS